MLALSDDVPDQLAPVPALGTPSATSVLSLHKHTNHRVEHPHVQM